MLADFLAEQRLAERGFVGDAVIFRIAVPCTKDAVPNGFAIGDIAEIDDGAGANLIGAGFSEIRDAGAGEIAFEVIPSFTSRLA